MVHNTKCKNFKYVYDSICIFFFKKKRVEVRLERLTYVDFCFKKVSNHFLFAQKYVIFWHSNTWINLAFGIHNTKAKNKSTFSSFFLQADDANAREFFSSSKNKSYLYILYKKISPSIVKKKQNDITLTLVVLGVLFRLKFALNGFVR